MWEPSTGGERCIAGSRWLKQANGTPENQDLVASFEGGLGQVDNAVGQVTHGFDTDPSVIPGEISAGILTFVVTEDEITATCWMTTRPVWKKVSARLRLVLPRRSNASRLTAPMPCC